jgi:hypothetical protein
MSVNSNSIVAHKIIGYFCTFVAQLVSEFFKHLQKWTFCFVFVLFQYLAEL